MQCNPIVGLVLILTILILSFLGVIDLIQKGEDNIDCPGKNCSCAEGETRICGTNVGVCEFGVEICELSGDWGECLNGIFSQDEVCGNGIDEDCDGSDLSCGSDGGGGSDDDSGDDDGSYDGDVGLGAVCGNGIVDDGETCDGSNFSDYGDGSGQCSFYNFDYLSGDLICNICQIEVTGCSECPVVGDGISNDIFGVAQNLNFADQDYSSYIIEQKDYSNAIALSFVYNETGVVVPTVEYLKLSGGYSSVSISLGKNLWKYRNSTQRKDLYQKINDLTCSEMITSIVVIDEPYLEGFTPIELDDMIEEVRTAFSDKQLIVNFNRRGFYPDRQGLDAPIPSGVDRIGFDLYPCNFYYQGEPVGYDDEVAWKALIIEMATMLKSKTTAPITYVAQGFGKVNCSLTAENVLWSYEAAEESNLAGIMFWFSENQEFSGLRGFSAYPEAKEKIIELGNV